MPRRARIHFVSLRSSLVNLPISIYGPLVERGVRPQQLAVHLILEQTASNAKNEVYVGWTGMASASSLSQFNTSSLTDKGLETLEIDPQYGQALGFRQDDVVEIGLLHDLPLATSVAAEPVTADDWDIIEIHASHVESTLLSQVRVAQVDQEINVWVLGRTRCRLKVVSIGSHSKENKALVLTTNTEVSVAPKLHRQTKPSPLPSREKTAGSRVEGNLRNISQVFRVVPPSLLPLELPSNTNAQDIVGYISEDSLSKLFPDINPSDGLYYQVDVKRLRPPADPTANSTPSALASAPKILNPGESGKNPTPYDFAPGTIYITSLPKLPPGHAVFPKLDHDWADWDLIKITVTTESTRPVLQKALPPTVPHSKPFLAGMNDILRHCIEFFHYKMITHACKRSLNGVSALLLTGQSGSGKTSIAKAVAKSLEQDIQLLTYTLYVDVSRFSNKPVATVKALFKYWFEKSVWHKPTILILDNLHTLLSVEAEHADSFRSRHLTELFLSIYSSAARSAAQNSKGIVVLATAPSLAELHPLISSMHIFDEIVPIKPPNKDARKEIITKLVNDCLERATGLHEDPETPLNYAYLATQTEGYSVTDLQDLVARAMHQVAIRMVHEEKKHVLTLANFDAAQTDFVPLNLRDVQLQKSAVSWEDIGGLHEVRRVLRETLEWPTKYGPIFAQSPLRLRSGLLLYGYPGCGKTLLASAVAKECGLNFISVKGPEILNKYIGASEKTVRELFERASAAKPCVLFFDEFDSIAPKRGHDSTGVTDRVVNQMLTQMDGAEGLDGVYVLAATSRPDLIDSALLRPGRLDKSILCNMPNLEERHDILKVISQKVILGPTVKLPEIAELTEGFSGADLQALVYNANLEVIHSSFANHDMSPKTSDDKPLKYTSFGAFGPKIANTEAQKTDFERRLRQIQTRYQSDSGERSDALSTVRKPEIEQEHLISVLRTTKSSVSPEERRRLEHIYRAFISDRSGDLPEPPNISGIGNRVSLG